MVKRKAKAVESGAAPEPPQNLSDEEIANIQYDFRAAVDTKDVEKVANALHKYWHVLGCSHPFEDDDADTEEEVALTNGNTELVVNTTTPKETIVDHDPMHSIRLKAVNLLEEWKSELRAGDTVDYYRLEENRWYNAKILEKKGDLFSLHYNGWGKKYDDKNISFSHSKFFPSGTATVLKKKPAKKPKLKHFEIVAVVKTDDSQANGDVGDLDRDGRRARAARVVPDETSQGKKLSKRKKTKEELDLEDSMRRDWVCSICHQLEAIDDSDLILCDGLCKRSFHLLCLNLPEDEGAKLLAADSHWVCDECQAGRHTCFVCGDEGEDHEEVIKCCKSDCGKFYHYECITRLSAPYTLKKKVKPVSKVSKSLREVEVSDSEKSSSSKMGELSDILVTGKRQIKKPARFQEEDDMPERDSDEDEKNDEGFAQFDLKCPYHFCDTCHVFYEKQPSNKNNTHLHKCFRCPRAFHTKCIPPTSRYNDHALLCPNHPNDILPTFEPMTLEEQLEEKRATRGCFKYIWDQMQLPLRPPLADKITDTWHFRLPSYLEEEVSSHPPTFKLIWKNDYDALRKNESEEEVEGVNSSKVNVPLQFTDEMCECIEKCDERCLNRISKIECFDRPNKKDPICNVGKDCGNRQFMNREYVKVQPFQEYGMGWGLKAKEDVCAGTLVIEYMGEILTEAQMMRRMTLQAELTPHDRDFYVMELSNGLFVDGKKKGNLSRFINHSCDPNCELVRWSVKGQTRIGIFAVRDIKADEPLSYDYQFDTSQADTFRCGCGTKKCRGTMAPKKKVVSKESLSKKDMKRLIAAGRRRENKFSLTEEEWKRSDTGKYLPGDKILEVRNGPLKNAFRFARETKLFLPRNTKLTENFLDRRKLMWLKSTADTSSTETASSI